LEKEPKERGEENILKKEDQNKTKMGMVCESGVKRNKTLVGVWGNPEKKKKTKRGQKRKKLNDVVWGGFFGGSFCITPVNPKRVKAFNKTWGGVRNRVQRGGQAV